MKFSPLIVRVDKNDRRLLVEPLRFFLGPEVKFERGDVEFEIPAGYITDFASIPKYLRGVITRTDTEIAGVCHDYMVEKSCLPRVTKYSVSYMYIRRNVADKIFYEILRYQGVGFVKARLMYLGVRMFSIYKQTKRGKGNRR